MSSASVQVKRCAAHAAQGTVCGAHPGDEFQAGPQAHPFQPVQLNILAALMVIMRSAMPSKRRPAGVWRWSNAQVLMLPRR